MVPRVILITGASSGLGNELVRRFLQAGEHVVATSRKSANLKFSDATSENFVAIDCDVTSKDSVQAAFKAAVDKFPRIDVIFNNAGFGLGGDFESLSDRQIRAQMDVNFFGVLNVTREALKIMRDHNKPCGGQIHQMSSIWGQIGWPLVSTYCASKYAVEGFSDALRLELKPEWNISLICIEPGGFRTEWAGSHMVFGEEKSTAYDHLNVQEWTSNLNGTQPGDPRKAADAIFKMTQMRTPPPRIVLGSDAWKNINDKMKEYAELVPEYKDLTMSTDFD